MLVARKAFKPGEFICFYGGLVLQNNDFSTNSGRNGRYQIDIAQNSHGAAGFAFVFSTDCEEGRVPRYKVNVLLAVTI